MNTRQTPCVAIPATFPIGGSYHCNTRPLLGTPHTLYCIYRTIDGRELGRQISWPCGDDARRLEHRYESWMRATKGRGVPLEQWATDVNARSGAKRAAEIKTPTEWVSL